MIRCVDCGELKEDAYIYRPLCVACAKLRPKSDLGEPENNGPHCDGVKMPKQPDLADVEAYYRYKSKSSWWNL